MLSNTTSECYFSDIHNKSFHNLTKSSAVPNLARKVLGLCMKFAPTPSRTMPVKDAIASAERLTRQIGIKAYFAGEESDARAKTKLYKPSA